MTFDDVAYKNVVSNGLVLDKNGQKMSKRLGNAADPFETLEKHGPDATRWYMISNANPWDNLKFDPAGIEEVKRKFFGTLYNTYSFFVLYANLDNFTFAEEEIPVQDRPEIDRWILSELHSLIDRTDKISAYQTLYTCLVTIAKLAAPVAPFFMERLYKDLNAITSKENFESVHLSHFPKSDTNSIDTALEHKMQKAQAVCSLVLSLRAKEKIKVRQPLQRIMIPVLGEADREEIEAVADLIKSEVNVKEVSLINEDSGILVKQIKPNFKVLGPRFGKDMKLVVSAIQQFEAEDISQIERDGQIDIEINGKMTILESGDVEISSKDIEGWLVASQDALTVALDVTINDTLKKEGVARELVNRIQNLRKDSGFEVTDRINVTIQSDGVLEDAVMDNITYIKQETLTDNLQVVHEITEGLTIEFDEIKTKLAITKN